MQSDVTFTFKVEVPFWTQACAKPSAETPSFAAVPQDRHFFAGGEEQDSCAIERGTTP